MVLNFPCFHCADKPDGGQPTEGLTHGGSSRLWHLQGREEERRPMLSNCQPGAPIDVFLQPHSLTLTYGDTTWTCFSSLLQFECQYCQYHVKAQYKKMSSKRAELQSSFSGKAPNKVKGSSGGLRERLCQEGFHYGGMSSPACAASL